MELVLIVAAFIVTVSVGAAALRAWTDSSTRRHAARHASDASLRYALPKTVALSFAEVTTWARS